MGGPKTGPDRTVEHGAKHLILVAPGGCTVVASNRTATVLERCLQINPLFAADVNLSIQREIAFGRNMPHLKNLLPHYVPPSRMIEVGRTSNDVFTPACPDGVVENEGAVG